MFTLLPLGNVVNKPEHGSLDWVKICERSSKVITFIDLAGHERYLKTTVFGMTGHAPDFGMLMVRKLILENMLHFKLIQYLITNLKITHSLFHNKFIKL